MPEQPLVSIAAINYNNERFVIATLESIRNQTYQNIELVIVDDCSTDGSMDLINEWLKGYTKPYKIVKHEKNKGVSGACNSGVQNATGKYYSAIATDDIMLPEKTQIQVAILEAKGNNVGAVYSDAYLIDEDGTQREALFIPTHKQFAEIPSGNIYEILLQGNYIPGMTFLFRRSIFNEVGPFDETLIYEDYDMWLRIARKYQIIYAHTPSAQYRLRVNSLRTSIKNWIYSDARIFLKHTDGPIPVERIKNIIREAYAKGDGQTMALFKEYAAKTKNRFFKAAWLLWKYKVTWPTAEIILGRIDGYCSVNVSNWYIDLCIYKDILGAMKTSNSSYFSRAK